LANFNYIASDKEGKILRGFLQANTKDSVLDYLENHNLIPISVKEKEKSSKIVLPWQKKVTIFDKIILFDHLSAMLSSGVPLSSAMDVIIEDTENSYLKEILEESKYALEKGETLSRAFSKYEDVFSQVDLGLIRAGEKSGKLEKTLKHITIQLKRERSLISKVKSAMVYPGILFAGTFLVIFLLLTFVLPRIISIFQEANIAIPLPTKILLFISSVLSVRLYITFPILALLIILIWWGLRSEGGRRFGRSIGLKIPLIKDLIGKIELARFTRTMSSLLSSGVPMVEAVKITSKVLSGSSYHKVVRDFLPDLEKGVSFGNILKKRKKYFPNILIAMVDVGETTGSLSKVLLKLAKFYEEETNIALKRVVSTVEPLLLLIVGLFVAGIALSIVLPVYKLIGQFTQY
jgi:type II secretory pathway component PulF